MLNRMVCHSTWVYYVLLSKLHSSECSVNLFIVFLFTHLKNIVAKKEKNTKEERREGKKREQGEILRSTNSVNGHNRQSCARQRSVEIHPGLSHGCQGQKLCHLVMFSLCPVNRCCSMNLYHSIWETNWYFHMGSLYYKQHRLLSPMKTAYLLHQTPEDKNSLAFKGREHWNTHPWTCQAVCHFVSSVETQVSELVVFASFPFE